MVTPLSIAFFNSFLIPMMVFYTTECMFFETVSARTKNRLNKYYFFILMNTIILPLCQFYEIKEFIQYISEDGFQYKDFFDKVSNNVINQT